MNWTWAEKNLYRYILSRQLVASNIWKGHHESANFAFNSVNGMLDYSCLQLEIISRSGFSQFLGKWSFWLQHKNYLGACEAWRGARGIQVIFRNSEALTKGQKWFFSKKPCNFLSCGDVDSRSHFLLVPLPTVLQRERAVAKDQAHGRREQAAAGGGGRWEQHFRNCNRIAKLGQDHHKVPQWSQARIFPHEQCCEYFLPMLPAWGQEQRNSKFIFLLLHSLRFSSFPLTRRMRLCKWYFLTKKWRDISARPL